MKKNEEAKMLAQKVNSLRCGLIIGEHALLDKYTIIYQSRLNCLEVLDMDMKYEKGNYLNLSINQKEFEKFKYTKCKLAHICSLIMGVDEIDEYESSFKFIEPTRHEPNKVVLQLKLYK